MGMSTLGERQAAHVEVLVRLFAEHPTANPLTLGARKQALKCAAKGYRIILWISLRKSEIDLEQAGVAELLVYPDRPNHHLWR